MGALRNQAVKFKPYTSRMVLAPTPMMMMLLLSLLEK